MKTTYQVEMTLTIDPERRQEIIDKARKYYLESGGSWNVDSDLTRRPIPVEEAIGSVDEALIELLHNHPAFDADCIALTKLSCDTEEGSTDVLDFLDEPWPEAVEDASDDPEPGAPETQPRGSLDEFETGIYLCRWPNGDVSVVTAINRRLAIVALDEWGGAHPSQLHPIYSFMADFTLTDEGEIALRDLGESTGDDVWDVCYPKLRELLGGADILGPNDEITPLGRQLILDAVNRERTRLRENQPTDEAATEIGKSLAERMGTSAVVADYYVEQRASAILESEDGDEGKPN